MDRNFERSLAEVLKHEGGWVNHPKDPGGATMKGVTLATFRGTVKPNATKEDLRKITDDQLRVVYRRHFWDKVLGAELPDGLDHAVFDFAVNSGPGRAVRVLQQVVGARVDGIVGPKTLDAIRELPLGTVIGRLCDERLAYMQRIKNRKTGERLWPTFGKGWSRRVDGVRAFALLLSAQPTDTKMPAKPAKDATVVLAPGREPDTTTVIVAPHPKSPPAGAPEPGGISKTGWTSIGAVFAVIAAALAQCGVGD